MRRRVVCPVEAEVLHRGQRYGAHRVHGPAVGHEIVAHDARLPVGGPAQLGQAHQRQPGPRAVGRAVEVQLRQLVRASLGEVPHLIGRTIEVDHRQQREEAFVLAARVGGRAEVGVGEPEPMEDLVHDERAVLLQQLLQCALHADNLLNPSKYDPCRPARRVGGAGAAGTSHTREERRLCYAQDDVERHPRLAVGRRDRRAAEQHAIARARLFRQVAVAIVHARVPP
mmetsp:Transcript_11949/g.24272  ORF Transcript_11949/g.24272 Transcript_11949/m.24272 type:complete len:227 (+) Transcript_11949:1791-2471(+)